MTSIAHPSYDAQRRHLGQALLTDFLDEAYSAGVKLVTLRCLNDLDANGFWASMGFDHVGDAVSTLQLQTLRKEVA